MNEHLWISGPDPTSSRRRKSRKFLVHTATNPVTNYSYESLANSRYVITFTTEITKYIEFYWRYVDNNNYFHLSQDSDTGDIYINKKVVGTPTILYYEEGVFTDTKPCELVVEAEGQYHGIRMDGALVYERFDAMLPSEPGLKFYHNYATNDIVIRVYS